MEENRKVSPKGSDKGEVFVVRRRAEFHETDAAGVVHFSRILCWVEEAEHGWLRAHGIEPLGGGHGLPRVALRVSFRAPCPLWAVCEVRIINPRAGRSTLRYGFECVLAADSGDGQDTGGRPAEEPGGFKSEGLVAAGAVTLCCVTKGEGLGWRPVPLPAEWREALGL